MHWLRSNDIASSSPATNCSCVGSLPDRIRFESMIFGDDNERDKGGEPETMERERENGHNSDKEDGGSHDNDESMIFYEMKA